MNPTGDLLRRPEGVASPTDVCDRKAQPQVGVTPSVTSAPASLTDGSLDQALVRTLWTGRCATSNMAPGMDPSENYRHADSQKNAGRKNCVGRSVLEKRCIPEAHRLYYIPWNRKAGLLYGAEQGGGVYTHMNKEAGLWCPAG